MPLSCSAIPGMKFNDDLESHEATEFIAWYTFLLHLLVGFYFLDIYRGSVSNWVPSLVFELSGDSQRYTALWVAIFCFSFMIFASLGLIRGVRTKTRIYYFPWLWLTVFEELVVTYQVFWLFFRYSYDTETMISAMAVLFYIIYHSYLYAVVLSNYRYLKKIQNPTLIFPPHI